MNENYAEVKSVTVDMPTKCIAYMVGEYIKRYLEGKEKTTMSKANDELLPVNLFLFGPNGCPEKFSYWFRKETVRHEYVMNSDTHPFISTNTECLIYDAWVPDKTPIYGYKAFYKEDNGEWFCRSKKYEVGATYVENVFPIMCIQGMHFCNTLANVFNYYPMDADTKIARVKATGRVVTDKDHRKFCTDRLVILEEIPWETAAHILNVELSYWLNKRNSLSFMIADGMDFDFSVPLRYAIHHSFVKDLLEFIYNEDGKEVKPIS